MIGYRTFSQDGSSTGSAGFKAMQSGTAGMSSSPSVGSSGIKSGMRAVSSSGQSSPPSSPTASTRLRGSSFRVTRRAATLDFYTTVLGMKIRKVNHNQQPVFKDRPSDETWTRTAVSLSRSSYVIDLYSPSTPDALAAAEYGYITGEARAPRYDRPATEASPELGALLVCDDAVLAHVTRVDSHWNTAFEHTTDHPATPAWLREYVAAPGRCMTLVAPDGQLVVVTESKCRPESANHSDPVVGVCMLCPDTESSCAQWVRDMGLRVAKKSADGIAWVALHRTASDFSLILVDNSNPDGTCDAWSTQDSLASRLTFASTAVRTLEARADASGSAHTVRAAFSKNGNMLVLEDQTGFQCSFVKDKRALNAPASPQVAALKTSPQARTGAVSLAVRKVIYQTSPSSSVATDSASPSATASSDSPSSMSSGSDVDRMY